MVLLFFKVIKIIFAKWSSFKWTYFYVIFCSDECTFELKDIIDNKIIETKLINFIFKILLFIKLPKFYKYFHKDLIHNIMIIKTKINKVNTDAKLKAF